MATASVSYALANGTSADATQVATNFTDLVNFLNTHVVHKDGSVSMTGQLSLYASDPTDANHATRKQYVDRKVPTIQGQQVGLATSYSSGSTMTTLTITDPGYDIELWGWVTTHFAASASGSIWQLAVYVDGTFQSGLVVPFVSITAPYGISIGTPVKRATHTTGSNTSVVVKMNNVYGGGTVTLGSPSGLGDFDDHNYIEVMYRKNG